MNITHLLQILGAAAGLVVAVTLCVAAVSEWIDRAPEGPEAPRWETDYRPMLPRCSYAACGAQSAGTVADFELCREHLDALLPQSATPMWV